MLRDESGVKSTIHFHLAFWLDSYGQYMEKQSEHKVSWAKLENLNPALLSQQHTHQAVFVFLFIPCAWLLKVQMSLMMISAQWPSSEAFCLSWVWRCQSHDLIHCWYGWWICCKLSKPLMMQKFFFFWVACVQQRGCKVVPFSKQMFLWFLI